MKVRRGGASRCRERPANWGQTLLKLRDAVRGGQINGTTADMAAQVREIILEGAMPSYTRETPIGGVTWPWPEMRQQIMDLGVKTLGDLAEYIKDSTNLQRLSRALNKATRCNYAINLARGAGEDSEFPRIAAPAPKEDEELPPIEDGPADDQADPTPEQHRSEEARIEKSVHGDQEPDNEPANDVPQRMSREGLRGGRVFKMVAEMDQALADVEAGLTDAQITEKHGWPERKLTQWRTRNAEFRDRWNAIRQARGESSENVPAPVKRGGTGPRQRRMHEAPPAEPSPQKLRVAAGKAISKLQQLADDTLPGDEAEAYSTRVTDKLPARPDTTELFPPFPEPEQWTPEQTNAAVQAHNADLDLRNEVARTSSRSYAANERLDKLEAGRLEDAAAAEAMATGIGRRLEQLEAFGARIAERMDDLDRPKIDPFIHGLVNALPAPGSVWDEDGRNKWLNAAEAIFEISYKYPFADVRFGKLQPEAGHKLGVGVIPVRPGAFPAEVEREAAHSVPGRVGHGRSPARKRA
jgi:hypothetical protein